MCGRARCTLRADDVTRACHRTHAPVRTVIMDRYRPLYNVSPGSNLPVVRREDGADGDGVVLQCMKWGLIPGFTKKTEKPDFYRMFNARSESICEMASFRRLVPKSRCIVAVEGGWTNSNLKPVEIKRSPRVLYGEKVPPHLLASRPLFSCFESCIEMCGRARCTLRADDVTRACHRTHAPVRTVNMDRYRPSYNVSPGSNLPVVRREDGADGDGVVLQCMKWGLIPSFTKKTEKPDFYRMFNARSESICEKASFRRLVPKSRCIVAVEGFYEWKKDGSKRQPYYVHFKDGRPLLFAALYDSWENSEGEKLYTFTIITTSSSSALGWLHDRMPVILGDKESTDTWLDGSSSSNFDSLLKPYEGPDLAWYPVTSAMGKVSFDGPECINEIQLKAEGNNSITKFFSAKGTKKEELNPKDTSSDDTSAKKDLSKMVKEEPESKEDTEQPYSTEQCEDESKCNVSTLSQEGVSKGQAKRDYEEFSADSKPAAYVTNKKSASLAKKKVNPKSSLDKQPTLFSYFGKS